MKRGVSSIANDFQRYFTVEFAGAPENKTEVYAIRYRVYCEEFKYEPIGNFPDKLEKDYFDDFSLHCLIRHKRTNRAAGCVRLVPAGVDGFDNLPMEAHCRESLDRGLLDNLQLNRERTCEVSRLAVDSAFRRRVGEGRTRFGDVDAIDCTFHERRTFSLISVAAYLAATSLTKITGMTIVFAMMEPFLPRLLAKSGIIFDKVGGEIDYHGLRAPYFATTEAVLANMQPDLKELYDAIYPEINDGYQTHLSVLQ